MTQYTVAPEVRTWILSQALNHPAYILWQTMMKSGWSREMSAQAIHTVLDVDLLADEEKPIIEPKKAPFINLEGMPTVLDAGDKKVSVLAVVKNPHIVILGDVLTSDECDELIKAAEPKMKRSKTVDVKTGGDETNDVRTSNGMFFNKRENSIVQVLERRIHKLIDWPEEKGEGLQILQYKPGAEYKPHYDYFDPTLASSTTLFKRGGQRVGTFIVYLKEPEKGGGTVFPDVDFEVLPKKGQGVFFNYPIDGPSSKSLHGGSPVIEGEKWIATRWLREENFR